MTFSWCYSGKDEFPGFSFNKEHEPFAMGLFFFFFFLPGKIKLVIAPDKVDIVSAYSPDTSLVVRITDRHR